MGLQANSSLLLFRKMDYLAIVVCVFKKRAKSVGLSWIAALRLYLSEDSLKRGI